MMKKRQLTIASMLLALSLLIAGCSSNSNQQLAPEGSASSAAPAIYGEIMDTKNETAKMVAGDAPAEMPEPAPMGGGSTGGGFTAEQELLQERKLIYTTSVLLETTEFEKTNADIQTLVTQFGGYIENSYIDGTSIYGDYNNRTANYTLRVPVGKDAGFVSQIRENFHLRNIQQSTQDITKSYYDTDTWLKTLEERYKRLEELEKNAEELDILLQIEQEMANVRYEINTTYSQLENMNAMTSYSTVNVSIQEVYKHTVVETDQSFGARIRSAFENSWANFGYFLENSAIGVVESLPFLLFLLIVIIVVIIVLRKRSRKRKPKNSEIATPPAAIPPEQPEQK